MVLSGICLLVTVVYFVAMLLLLYGGTRVSDSSVNLAREPKTGFSVCIPFRNEAEALPGLLNSLKNLEYPEDLVEFFLINDNSTDNSEALCSRFLNEHQVVNVHLLQNVSDPVSPKKQALEQGIAKAQHRFVVTTDADCILPKKWLRFFDAHLQKENCDLVAGPVVMRSAGNFLNRFQQLDFLSLQSATLGGFGLKKPFMCNGANLCYAKSSFLEVKGFSAHKTVASGDDIFLLEKVQNHGFKSGYLKNPKAAVRTDAPKTWKALVQQRLRWAAKTSRYDSAFGKGLGLVVFLMNLIWIFSLAAALFQLLSWQTWLVVFVVKFNVDFVVIYRAARFFEKDSAMRAYALTAVLHPFFIVFIAVKAIFSKYRWKGRQFKR